METSLNTVTARRSMGNNARTVTISAKNKRYAGRNRKTKKKKKRKRKMSPNRYIMTSSFLAMTHSSGKINKSTRKLMKFLLLTQDLPHIW